MQHKTAQYMEAQIQQLNEARNVVHKDPAYWPQVLKGVLPIINNPAIEIRRWGSGFLSETFSTPLLEPSLKQELGVICLHTIGQLIENNDTEILKNVVQCSASLYPSIFRHLCSNRNETVAWNHMSMIKSKVLHLWDSAPIGVQLCCIKFAQRVILVQSRGATDPRLVDRSELNLGNVPSNHPILSLSALDAEAQGLLDRLLNILSQDYRHVFASSSRYIPGWSLPRSSDPTLVTAIINTLAPIIKSRPPLATKVLNAVTAFNPFTGMKRCLTTQNRLIMISMEKTVRSLCLNIMRFNPSGPYVNKLSQHVSRLSQKKTEINEEFSRKRAATSQQQASPKRQKLERGDVNAILIAPHLSLSALNPETGHEPIVCPMSYAKLYTLATDPGLTHFEGQQLPLDLVVRIVIGSLYSTKADELNNAIETVKFRYNLLAAAADTGTTENALAMSAATDQGPRFQKDISEDEDLQLELGEFRLPPPIQLTPNQLKQASLDSVDRIFGVIDEFEKKALMARKTKLGVGRLAASDWDREGWVAVLIRLATRGFSFQNQVAEIEDEQQSVFCDMIRQKLYAYVIDDFRGRMDVAIAWLNEEWYNDMMYVGLGERKPQYRSWMMKLMDSIFPFLEARDRTFMRILSEIPEITVELLDKVRLLCLDPDRVALGIQMLHFLAMLRPTIRIICLDVLEDLWQNQPELRKQVQKLLQKWRPGALEIKSQDIASQSGGPM